MVKKDGLYSKALQGKRWPVTEMKHVGLQTRTKKIEPAMKRAAAQERSPKNLEGDKYGCNPYATGKSTRISHP